MVFLGIRKKALCLQFSYPHHNQNIHWVLIAYMLLKRHYVINKFHLLDHWHVVLKIIFRCFGNYAYFAYPKIIEPRYANMPKLTESYSLLQVNSTHRNRFAYRLFIIVVLTWCFLLQGLWVSQKSNIQHWEHIVPINRNRFIC